MITAKDVKVYKNTDTDTPYFPQTGGCLYCENEASAYAYYDCGSHIVRRFCKSEDCRKKAIKGVLNRVNNG